MGERTRLLFAVSDVTWSDDAVFGLYFLRWIRESTDHDVVTYTWEGGALADAYRAEAPLVDLSTIDEWSLPRALALLGLRRIGAALKSRRLRRWLRRLDPDVVVANDATASRVLGFLAPGARVVARVDDLARPDARTRHPHDLATTAQRAEVLLAATEDAAARAATRLGLERAAVLVGRLPVPRRTTEADRGAIRRGLGLAPDALVVAAPGSSAPWDDPDRFVLVAWRLLRDHPDHPWTFVWLTGDDERVLWPLRHELRNAHLTARSVLTVEPTPLDLLQVADVLVLPGRDPTVPRLWEEAVAAHCPVVAFAHGDLAGRAAAGGGRAVPYLDLDAMVSEVVRLATDPTARAEVTALAAATAARPDELPPAVAALLHRIDATPDE